MNTKHVIIVGGGITGLASAFYLRKSAEQAGFCLRCTLIEQSSRLGGKIDTLRQDGFVMERGPESMLARKADGINLIRDLGIESEITYTNPRNQGTFVARDGRLVPMPKGTNLGVPVQLSAFLQTPLLSPKGKLRALADLVLPSGWTPADETLGNSLRRRFGEELVTRLCEPLLAGIYAGGLDSLSAEATFPQFRAMERDCGSLIVGARQSSRRQKAGLSPQGNATAGSAIECTRPESASTTSGRSAFITLKSGLTSMVERLYDSLDDWCDFEFNTEVVKLEQTCESSAKFLLTLRRTGATEPDTVPADAVVLTTPADVAKSLLMTCHPDLPNLMNVPYVSTATVLLGYREEDTDGKIQGSGFVVPRDESVAITACTYLSSKWDHVAPAGYSVIRCYVGRRGQTEDLAAPDSKLIELAKDAMKTLVGLDATPVFAKVSRFDNAMPQYLVGHLNRLAELRHKLQTEVPGLYVAGGGYDGVGIPDCIKQAKKTAQSVLSWIKS